MTENENWLHTFGEFFPQITSSRVKIGTSLFVKSPSMSAQLPPAPLVKALRHILRPVVRLLLAKGIGYTYLSDLLKEIYVDVALREFGLPGKAQTDSRITLLTGVHRKDVKRIREMEHETLEAPESVSLGMRVVSAWSHEPFADEEGLPAPLPRLASQGGDKSFEGLVASVSKDIRARALLDEWLRLGVVRIDEQDRVVIDTAAFVPSGSLEQQAFYLGHNLHDHAAAAVTNVLAEKGVFLERSVHYEGMTADAVAALAKEAERSGMRLLHSLNKKSLESQKTTKADVDLGRYTCGIYFYSEKNDGEGDA